MIFFCFAYSSHIIRSYRSFTDCQLPKPPNPGCHAKALIWIVQVWAQRKELHWATEFPQATFRTQPYSQSLYQWSSVVNAHFPKFERGLFGEVSKFLTPVKSPKFMVHFSNETNSFCLGHPNDQCAPRFFDPFASICKSQGPRISPDWWLSHQKLAPTRWKYMKIHDHPICFFFSSRGCLICIIIITEDSNS